MFYREALTWLAIAACCACVRAQADDLQLRVRVNGAEPADLHGWLQPADAPGMRLTGDVHDHVLKLPTGVEYLLAYEADGRVPEFLYVDGRVPDDVRRQLQPPMEVVIQLEEPDGSGYDYTAPTGTILFRQELDRFGFADDMRTAFPVEMLEALHRTMVGTDPPSLAVRSPRAVCDDPDASRWLDATLRPCTRGTATYELRATGTDDGSHPATIHTLDGRLKARGSYADACHLEPHGTFTFYHDNGSVESTGAYVHGERSGAWKRFDLFGRELTEKYYDPSKLAGILGRQRFNNAADASLTADRYGTLATVVGRTPPSVHVIRYRPETDGSQERDHGQRVEAKSVVRSKPRVQRAVPETAREFTGREETLEVDRLNVITIVRVEEGSAVVEYRRVANYYGPVYYFRDGAGCTAERYAAATGREP